MRVGDRIFMAGTAPVAGRERRPEPDGAGAALLGDHRGRTPEAGATLRTSFAAGIFLVDAHDFDEIGAVHGELFADARPANTTLVVKALLDPWKVEIEVEAVAQMRGLTRGRPFGARRRSRRHHGRRAARDRGRWVAITDGVRERRRRPGRRDAAGRVVLDATGCLVTPGLVNTHHHIYQNLTRAYRPATTQRSSTG